MPSTSRATILGLWFFFTTASIGFVLLLAGLDARRMPTVIGGAAILGFATITYLGLHFWTTAHRTLREDEPVSAPAPQPAPVPVAKARARTPIKPAPMFDERVGWENNGSGVEQVVNAPVAPRLEVTATTNGHSAPAPVVSAVERRKQWIDQMPVARAILEDATPAPPTAPVGDGKTRGRCSGCNTILVAPATRPLRLRCPTCGRVAWIK